MTTIISGTNRAGSRSRHIANYLLEYLQSKEEAVQLLDLTDVPSSVFGIEMYSADEQHPDLRKLQEQYITAAERLIIVSPEYNGSYPGILKLFIDGISVYRYKENFKNKWTALVGVATGRAGNLRGLDHLSQSLLHMGGHVLPGKLPLSKVDQALDESGNISDLATRESLENIADSLLQL